MVGLPDAIIKHRQPGAPARSYILMLHSRNLQIAEQGSVDPCIQINPV
jgi:hypothetical protein